MTKFLSAICIVFVMTLVSVQAASLRINEFLAENDGGLIDSDGESPDWIEIQNTTASVVNLAGWRLTDNPTNLTKWIFPATNLSAGGYLIVFASGKDRANNVWPSLIPTALWPASSIIPPNIEMFRSAQVLPTRLQLRGLRPVPPRNGWCRRTPILALPGPPSHSMPPSGAMRSLRCASIRVSALWAHPFSLWISMQ
jgi:hypothetical protein